MAHGPDSPPSDAPTQHRSYAPETIGFATLTVSDSRTLGTDTSGQLLGRLITEAGYRRVTAAIVPDEAGEIRRHIHHLLGDHEVDVLITSGGTGFSPRDVTLSAVRPLFDVEVEGFGELFRMLSYQQVGAAAMLSRAAGGVVDSKVVFSLPGSPKAVELAMRQLILPEVGHLLGQVRRREGER